MNRAPTTDFNPLHFAACFFKPQRISDVRAWQQHIPFGFALMQMLRPRLFVELGTHKGDSYLAFCQVVDELCLPTRCVAVDTWQGDGQAGIYDDSIYEQLAAYHDPRYGGFSRLLRSTFDAALDEIADGSVDLLHVDGLHTYDAVRHDFETWRGKLSPRGVAIFHDIAVRKRGYEVHNYWNELRQRWPSFAFEHGNGLGVLAVGAQAPAMLAGLLELDVPAAAAARYFFEMLGKRVTATPPSTNEDAARVVVDAQPARVLAAVTADAAAARLAQWTDPPLLSLLVDETEGTSAEAALACLRSQLYPHWELIVLGADAPPPTAAGDARVRCLASTAETAASRRNAAIDAARGEFAGWLPAGAVLTADALYEAALALATEDADAVYVDEDRIDADNNGHAAQYKPDFSPDYLLATNYIGEFLLVRRTRLLALGGYRDVADGALAYDLALRLAGAGAGIAHVPRVLLRQRAARPASSDDLAWEAGRQALVDRLAHDGTAARIERGLIPGSYRVQRAIRGAPLVSILVPFRDKPELLEQCVRSVLARTHYPHFELIGIDNGSHLEATAALCAALAREDDRIRFVRDERPFNYSAVNNFGATHARGDHLLFLNNDTEVLDAGWLAAMLEHSQRPEVGVVGAQLRYADDSMQHCGVTLDDEVVAMHHHKFLAPGAPGYAGRPYLIQNASAVTFACAMSRRAVFDALGGLNEALRVCFNDVDYCLRAQEAGYLVVYTPYARLRHFESKSRGRDGDPAQRQRLHDELAFMQRRHADALARGDRYFNLRV